MTRRINGDALENRDGTAATGDVFVFDDAHVDGGEWEAPGAGSASAAWPVGSIFLSAVSTNPATLLGFGTWSAIGAGRVLIGIDAGDVDFDTLGETGGAKTTAHTHASGTIATVAESAHTHASGTIAVANHDLTHKHTINSTWPGLATITAHSGTAVGNHAVTQPSSHSPHGHDNGTLAINNHTTAELSHNHGFSDTSASTTVALFNDDKPVSRGQGTTDNGWPGALTHTFSGTIAASATLTHTGTAVDAHAVTQPSAHTLGGETEVVSTLSAVTHGVSGSTAAGSSHSHGVSGSTGSDSTSVVQPYLVVAIWQRTA